MTRIFDSVHCYWIAPLALALLLALAGCSGGGPADSVADDALSLPPLPAGDVSLREGSALDNDIALGKEYVISDNATDDGDNAVLLSGTAPGTELAYAVYEIPARPAPEKPYMLTVTTFYSDAEPVTTGGDEGYYIAIGNYGRGSWDVTGPYYKSIVRLPFGTVDVTSAAGNVYAAVIATQGATAFVVSVEVGYDAGPGWESRLMTPTQGKAAGLCCDIALDPAGAPQIAYLHTESMMANDHGDIYIARMVGAAWEVDRVDTPYEARVVQLALGSGGRRALLAEDVEANNYHLLWDSDGGNFDIDITIDPADSDGIYPSVAFCNGTDDPSGELDTAVVVYGVSLAYPNMAVRYYRYDGTTSAAGDVFSSTRQARNIDLYTDDNNQVRTAFAIAPTWPDWDLYFGVYSAVIDGWSFGTPPDWTGVPISTDSEELMVRATQTGTDEYVAAFVLEDFSGLQFGLSDSGPFSSKPADNMQFDFLENDYEIGSYSDGTVGFLTQAGNYTLGLYRGRPDSGLTWEFIQLTTEFESCSDASFALADNDTTHIAILNPVLGQLEYLSLDQFGETRHEVIDTGGGQPGLAFGPSPVATVGNDLYMFYADSPRMRILYSRMHNGMWQEEGVPLKAENVLPYVLLDAGYLEDTDLLYVVYLDFYDLSFSVLSCPPGENDWHKEFYSLADEVLVAVTDNESEVGLCYPFHNPISNDSIYFAKGDPRTGPEHPETITTGVSKLDYPWYLDYSQADDHWGLVVNDEDNLRVSYFERDGTGLWGPPRVVEQISGIGGFLNVDGLTHDAESGAARVVVRQGPTGPLPYDVTVYLEQPGGGFAPEQTIASVDPASVDAGMNVVLEDADGLPVIVVPTQAPATPWQMEIFMPDGPSTWSSETVWHSPVMGMMNGPMGLRGGMDPAGMPCLTAVEMYDGSELYGIPCVYYYW